MAQIISLTQLQSFLGKQSFPPTSGWHSLLHCLQGKQSCPNLSVVQQGAVQVLLQETLSGANFSKKSFVETSSSMDRILNEPYLKDLHQAIEETNTLITRLKTVTGRQVGAVGELEQLTVKTVLSDKSPKEMVIDLKKAFSDLVSLMEADAKVLENLSKTDQLTNLANRRGFDACLLKHCQSKNDYSLHLVMVDIDYFKKFNDEFGHLIGDEVLTLVATIIAKAAKSKKISRGQANLAARYGGEEFAIIMPACSDDECMAFAEFLRGRIEHYPVVIRDPQGAIIKKDVHLTVSIGVASVHSLWSKQESGSCSHLLIQAADQALYEAKKRGRNMICQHKSYKGANGRLTSVIL